MAEWMHVVHTYENGEARLYVNGVLDWLEPSARPPLAIKSPARLWIGGWYDNYDFVGDIDEVRISKVARSADWVRLQYENQKPLQTLVGPLVQPGNEFAVSPERADRARKARASTLTAKAGGAQKVYWILKRDGREDGRGGGPVPLHVRRRAGRLATSRVTLQFKAIYADGVKTKDIPITIKEDIPEPVFTLEGAGHVGRPRDDRGRAADRQSRRDAGQGRGRTEVRLDRRGQFAVIKEVAPGKLILKRAQNSGHADRRPRSTTAAQRRHAARHHRGHRTEARCLGGSGRRPRTRSRRTTSSTPATTGTKARCTTTARSTRPADAVFLKVFADDQLYQDREPASSAADKILRLRGEAQAGADQVPGRVRLEDRRQRDGAAHRDNLVCGDAYLINGQSNAVATDFGKERPRRSTASGSAPSAACRGNPKATGELWGEAGHRRPRRREAADRLLGHGTGQAAGREPEDADLHHQRRRRRHAHRPAPAEPEPTRRT